MRLASPVRPCEEPRAEGRNPPAETPGPVEGMTERPAALRLGARIRARRLELGLTLRELSAAVGCSVAYLSEIERGSRTPRGGKAAEVAAALGLRAPRCSLVWSINQLAHLRAAVRPEVARRLEAVILELEGLLSEPVEEREPG